MNNHPLIKYLIDLERREDRAALASLRRANTSAGEASAYPIVARFFPNEPSPWKERALLDTACLFALHPSHGDHSLARALRRVQHDTASDSVEGRFVALLEAHADDLKVHLRHAVSLVRSQDLAIDWNDLLRAVEYWHHPDRFIQRRWARDFWTQMTSENPQ